MLTITGSPRDSNFFQGLDLTFTCDIELHSAVDSPVTVTGNWERNGTQLKDSASYTTVTNITVVTPPNRYQMAARFNPLNFDDSGTYTCVVTVMPHNTSYISGTLVSATRTITSLSG